MKRAALFLALAACGSPSAPRHIEVAAPSTTTATALPAITTSTTSLRTSTTQRANRSARVTPTPSRPNPPTGDDVWRRLANCESPTGRDSSSGGFHGYFQFTLSTARSVGLVNDPHTYSYEEQKAAAQRLQARSGWNQWPTCARKMGLI